MRKLTVAAVVMTMLPVASCEHLPSMPMGHMGMGHHGHMMGAPVKGTDPENLPDKDSPGARAFSQYCQQCHALPSPTQHTASEWPGVVQRMQGNIRSMGKTMPSPQEAQDILAYLKQHAKR